MPIFVISEAIAISAPFFLPRDRCCYQGQLPVPQQLRRKNTKQKEIIAVRGRGRMNGSSEREIVSSNTTLSLPQESCQGTHLSIADM
jgi:hypothetical protein